MLGGIKVKESMHWIKVPMIGWRSKFWLRFQSIPVGDELDTNVGDIIQQNGSII